MTVVETVTDRPCESNMETEAVPVARACNWSAPPEILALSTALLPLLTAYGPTPPPIAKDWLTPFLRFRSAGAVV